MIEKNKADADYNIKPLNGNHTYTGVVSGLKYPLTAIHVRWLYPRRPYLVSLVEPPAISIASRWSVLYGSSDTPATETDYSHELILSSHLGKLPTCGPDSYGKVDSPVSASCHYIASTLMPLVTTYCICPSWYLRSFRGGVLSTCTSKV